MRKKIVSPAHGGRRARRVVVEGMCSGRAALAVWVCEGDVPVPGPATRARGTSGCWSGCGSSRRGTRATVSADRCPVAPGGAGRGPGGCRGCGARRVRVRRPGARSAGEGCPLGCRPGRSTAATSGAGTSSDATVRSDKAGVHRQRAAALAGRRQDQDHLHRSRQPVADGFVENFHGRLRDGVEREQVWTLTEARVVVEDFRGEYKPLRRRRRAGLSQPGGLRGHPSQPHLRLQSPSGLLAPEMDNPTAMRVPC